MKERVAYFDNAKIILMVCVVFGHFTEPMVEESSIMKTLFLFIYSFHMPAFIFVSGYFSSGIYKRGKLFKLIRSFLLTYVIVQLVFIYFVKLIKVGNYQYTLKTPAYIYWYLFALFIWSIAIIILHFIEEKWGIKTEIFIVASFILGFLAGYFESISWEFSLSRIIVFFPFFLLGYYFKKQGLEVKTVFKYKWIPVLIVCIGLFLTIQYHDISIKWVWCSVPYSQLQVTGMAAMLGRLLLYVVQIMMMFSVLMLIPSGKKRYTKLGSMTMTIYLLHGFVVKWCLSLGYFDPINGYHIFLISMVAVVTIFLCCVIAIICRGK